MLSNRMNCSNIHSNKGTIYCITKENNEEFHNRLRRLYPCVEDISLLPQKWSPESKPSPLGLTQDNLGCYYRSNFRREDEKEHQTVSVRTEHHIPPACLLYYFEIHFISKGRNGFMGLGLTSSEASLSKLPGWVRGSYGYHGDDGHIFNGDGRGDKYGEIFTSGDVIGCGYNLVDGSCFFTKNGINLGKAFDDIPNDVLFYPTIGLKTHGEEIRANFGQEEFIYNIEEDISALRKNLTLTISDYPIADFEQWEGTIHRLVQSWLMQNSYPNTAAAFNKSTKLSSDEDMQRVQMRNRIQQLVLNGRISDAIKLTNDFCPSLLQDNPNLLFALKCRQFVEMIGGADNDSQTSVFNPQNNHTEVNGNAVSDEQRLTKLILFGQELFEYLRQLDKLCGRNEANERMLLDAIGLIAFANPKDPYYCRVLDPRERESISQLLNSSILKVEQGSNYKAPMDEVFNHLRDLVDLNNSQGRWLIDRLY